MAAVLGCGLAWVMFSPGVPSHEKSTKKAPNGSSSGEVPPPQLGDALARKAALGGQAPASATTGDAAPLPPLTWEAHGRDGARAWSAAAQRLDDLGLDIGDAAHRLAGQCAQMRSLDPGQRAALLEEERQLTGYLLSAHKGDIVLVPLAEAMQAQAAALVVAE